MATDGFIVLAPLVALPIVLLFGFVGCHVADIPGENTPFIELVWAPDLDFSDVKSISVTFSYSFDTGEAPSNLMATVPLDQALLKVLTSVDVTAHLDLTDLPDGHLHCDCRIELQSGTSMASNQQHRAKDELTVPFELVRVAPDQHFEVHFTPS